VTAGERQRRRFGAWLAAPAALTLTALLLAPTAAVLTLSFTDYALGGGDATWIGLANYTRALTEPAIRASLVNTAIYTVLVAPLSIGGALWIALVIRSLGRVGLGLQTVFFLPVTATIVALATAWEAVLHPSFGIVNALLGLLNVDRVRFLSDPDLVLATLAAIGVWKTLGFNVILYLAGLASIDRALYEAAALDGAEEGWRRFSLVTWAALAPVTLFVTIVTLIRTVSEFETVAVLTQGGPNGASDILLWTLHEEAFRFFEIGFAAALATTFLAIVALVSLSHVVAFERRRRA